MRQSKESRRNPRIPITVPIAICWQDSHGAFRSLQGRAIDICETGLQVEVVEAIDPHSSVTVRAEKLGLSAPTAVRYCLRQGPRYRLGLEFIAGTKWRSPTLPKKTPLQIA